MKYALYQNQRITPTKDIKDAICPICGELVIPKCGKIKMHHWAHKTSQNCDPWWENETEWHRKWKDHFPEDFQEYLMVDSVTGEKHIADIITVHTGDVGTSAIIDEELDGSLGFATIVSRINNPTVVMPKYVCYYLNSYRNKQNIASMTKSDRNNLNLKDFNKLTIPVPSMEEQKRIVSILDRFDSMMVVGPLAEALLILIPLVVK